MTTEFPDSWLLNREDLAAIDELVDEVVSRIADERIPIGAHGLTVRGWKIARPSNSGSDPEKIEASYSVDTGQISLNNFPIVFVDVECAKQRLEEFRARTRSVLVHELAHAKHHRVAGDQMDPGGASALSEDATTYRGYIAYVSHQAEMLAHSTQLAAEVIELGRPVDNIGDFQALAETTWLWGHVQNPGGGRSPTTAEEALEFGAVRKHLVDHGHRIYLRMTADQG